MKPTSQDASPSVDPMDELVRLTAENAELRLINRDAFNYIRTKTNQLLSTMGTRSLRAEELEDWSLLELDPIGVVTQSFQRVLENLRETNERLQLAHQEVKAVFEAVGAAVLVLDPNMRIVSYNERVRELLLNDDEIVAGVLCQNVLCRSEGAVQKCVHRKVMASGRPESIANFAANGRFFDVIGQPIHDPLGRVTHVVMAYNDVTEHNRIQSDLKAALQEVSRSKIQIDTLLRSMSDVLVATDNRRRIVLMNQAAEELLGICLRDSLGVPFLDVITHPELRAHLEAVAQGETYVLGDIEFVMTDGSVRIYQARTSALPATTVADQGRITLLHDVTRAREIEQIKDEFLSTAAHQLRTPLASVIGYSDLLIQADDIGVDARLEYLSLIHSKAEQLSEIVSNLLDISRIEAGEGAILSCQPHSAAAICQEAVSGFRHGSSVHRFELDMKPADIKIFVDHFAVMQVLENLLSNATKYSPCGGRIVVATRLLNGVCDISVHDEGIGMNDEQAAQAFEKFYRADASNTAIAGTGLGLTIVRHLVEAHGGHVAIDTRPGKGTSVHCTFPLAETMQQN